MKHIVGFSGGADSQALALLIRNHFPPEDIILINADPGGNEHPITSEFIENYSKNIFPVITVHPQVQDMFGKSPGKIAELGLSPTDPLTFDLMAIIKGMFPTTNSRFCTDHLKLYPMRRWMYENGGYNLNFNHIYGSLPKLEGILSEGYERYAGVRRDESDSRLWAEEREFDDFFMCYLNRPLVKWTKNHVFDYLISHSESFNPLYLLGFDRVGCAPCINSGKKDIVMWSSRFPEMIDKIRRWENRVGRPFFPPVIPTGVKSIRNRDESDKEFAKRKRSESRRYGFIDEVVEWSKTKHGGKEINPGLTVLQADIESGTCMSKYGLCE